MPTAADRVPLSRTTASSVSPGWRYVLGRLHLAVNFGSFLVAVSFVDEVAQIAEAQCHHPEIDLRYTTVHLATWSHDVGAVTARDVRLANAVSDLASRFDARVEHAATTELEIAIDTMDASTIRPFWRAVLGYVDDGDDALRDPHQRGPAVWFQQLSEPRPVRNRIHVDVSVPHDQLQARLDAALAAGGRLVSDAAAPSFWILADVDGNEACLCTWQGRDKPEA